MSRSLAFLLAICLTLSAAAQRLGIENVVGGLVTPVSLAHAGDTRLFIVEQAGRIVIWDGTRLLPTPFVDIRPLVSSGGERGLLGLAFHPRYPNNGFFYINYTDRNGDTVIARYTRSAADANRADPGSARVLLFVDQPFSNHNGGQLAFGPDGYLYIALGDGGSGGDPQNRAQNRADLLGKILRIDVDRGDPGPYAIPPDNPFVNTAGARGEVWAYGLRNPWRFSFDRVAGDLYIGDVGQAQREEINFQPASSKGGENYGWRIMEGSLCSFPNCNANRQFVEPVLEYNTRAAGACSVIGGYVYRGIRYPRLNGIYLFADYCNGLISGARRTSDGVFVVTLTFDAPLLISSFGEDANGEIYFTDHLNGHLFRIIDTEQLPNRRRSVRH